MKSLITWHRQRKLASYEARVVALEAKVKFLNKYQSPNSNGCIPAPLVFRLEGYIGEIASLKCKIAYLKLKLGIKD